MAPGIPFLPTWNDGHKDRQEYQNGPCSPLEVTWQYIHNKGSIPKKFQKKCDTFHVPVSIILNKNSCNNGHCPPTTEIKKWMGSNWDGLGDPNPEVSVSSNPSPSNGHIEKNPEPEAAPKYFWKSPDPSSEFPSSTSQEQNPNHVHHHAQPSPSTQHSTSPHDKFTSFFDKLTSNTKTGSDGGHKIYPHMDEATYQSIYSKLNQTYHYPSISSSPSPSLRPTPSHLYPTSTPRPSVHTNPQKSISDSIAAAQPSHSNNNHKNGHAKYRFFGLLAVLVLLVVLAWVMCRRRKGRKGRFGSGYRRVNGRRRGDMGPWSEIAEEQLVVDDSEVFGVADWNKRHD